MIASQPASDRLVQKKVDGQVVERSVYQGGNLSHVFNGSGTLMSRYLSGLGLNQTLAEDVISSPPGADGFTGTRWLLGDHQGSTRKVLNLQTISASQRWHLLQPFASNKLSASMARHPNFRLPC
jgi:hypothetical protein